MNVTTEELGSQPGSRLAVELAALRNQVGELSDRAAISALIDRYVVLLDTQDENDLDESWPLTVFTRDVRLRFPIGDHEGVAGVAKFHYEAKQKFARTLHHSSNHVIHLDGDRAAVRFHLTATHVHHNGDSGPLFDIGGYYTGEAVRTEQGWRLREWEFHLIWATGPGPNGKPIM
ncbi:nuclear transport factor 2 family protein [Streptomyces sp. NPDC091371]|uniref:nuclear transport factor 2 family protein n=1 Tax=Streptomyces sp. NPDC091371 TaxID=3155303 RepID=UPI00342D87DA